MTTLEQLFGVNAVGAMVAREFGDGIIYHGTITSLGKDGEADLYRVEYDDGDAEDMDRDEYNFAYALELSDKDGWWRRELRHLRSRDPNEKVIKTRGNLQR